MTRIERRAGGDLNAELLEELVEDAHDAEVTADDAASAAEFIAEDPIDLAKLQKEIAELEDCIPGARSIGVDTKSRALSKAMEIGFGQMAAMTPPAPRKAVIFTESCRTQTYSKE